MQHDNNITFKQLEQKYPFFKLMRPVGGVVETPVQIHQGELGIPDFKIFSTALGHMTMTAPHITTPSGGIVTSGNIGGAGSDETKELALVRRWQKPQSDTQLYAERSGVVHSCYTARIG